MRSPRVALKSNYSETFHNIFGQTAAVESFISKVAGLQSAAQLRESPTTGVFWSIFETFQNTYFVEYL